MSDMAGQSAIVCIVYAGYSKQLNIGVPGDARGLSNVGKVGYLYGIKAKRGNISSCNRSCFSICFHKRPRNTCEKLVVVPIQRAKH